MKIIEQRLEKFRKLSKQEQVEKVRSMLEILKKWDDFFQDFYEMIENLGESIDDDLLITIYSMIENAVIAIENEETQKNISKLSKTKEKLKKIKELEKQQENEDPDEMLSLLD